MSKWIKVDDWMGMGFFIRACVWFLTWFLVSKYFIVKYLKLAWKNRPRKKYPIMTSDQASILANELNETVYYKKKGMNIVYFIHPDIPNGRPGTSGSIL